MKVILMVVDSLRGDAPGFAGGGAPTPLMDQLAGEGTRFGAMTVSGSWTVPSLMSMATATFPHRMGVCRWRHPFPRHRPTLMSAFAAAGFGVSTFAYNPRWCFGNTPARGSVGDSQQPDEVIKALRAASSDHLFLIHHWWTHLPYINKKLPTGGWKRACAASLESLNRHPGAMAPKFRANYLKSVGYFDHEILGRYLDAASAGGDDVLLILTGDHGENWGESLPEGRRIEHIFDLHGRWLRDETAHVPLVLWGRGERGSIPAGATLDGTVRGVDMAPTIAGLAGVPWPGPLPEDDGPTLRGMGIAADGQGLSFDGHSLSDHVWSGAHADTADTLTIASHNTHQPDTYPEDGRKMWRTLGMRTADAWCVFDGVDQAREIVPHAVAEPQVAPETWESLEREWRGAVGPGEVLPKDLYPGGRDPEPGEADDREGVLEKMRMLGYLE